MKLNLLAAATRGILEKAEAEAAQRAMEDEVAQRLPMKDALKKLTMQMDGELNAALQVAIERFLGGPVSDPEILRGRLTHANIDDGLVYAIDGTAVLWVAPAKVWRDEEVLRAERPIRQLLADPVANLDIGSTIPAND